MSADWGPRAAEIEALVADLPRWPWLRPPVEVPEAEIAAAVAEHVDALRPYGYQETSTTRVVRTWGAARAAARDADWDADWDAALDAARVAARAAALDAARAADLDAARDAARDAAWDAAARAAARDAAWDAAWDAARDAAWVSVMPGPSPWRPLLAMWRRGLWPIGRVGDQFVVFHPAVQP